MIEIQKTCGRCKKEFAVEHDGKTPIDFEGTCPDCINGVYSGALQDRCDNWYPGVPLRIDGPPIDGVAYFVIETKDGDRLLRHPINPHVKFTEQVAGIPNGSAVVITWREDGQSSTMRGLLKEVTDRYCIIHPDGRPEAAYCIPVEFIENIIEAKLVKIAPQGPPKITYVKPDGMSSIDWAKLSESVFYRQK